MNGLPALIGWIQSSPWAFPAVESVHIVGFALLFGSVVIFDLRVLGLGRALSLHRLARHVLPWTVLGFCVAIPTGVLMFAANASELMVNRIFLAKMGLLLVAATNAALFHISYREIAGEPAPLSKALAFASIIVWICIIICGRWISYV
jgi:hypothetical protein